MLYLSLYTSECISDMHVSHCLWMILRIRYLLAVFIILANKFFADTSFFFTTFIMVFNSRIYLSDSCNEIIEFRPHRFIASFNTLNRVSVNIGRKNWHVNYYCLSSRIVFLQLELSRNLFLCFCNFLLPVLHLLLTSNAVEWFLLDTECNWYCNYCTSGFIKFLLEYYIRYFTYSF